jgi:hypothetical protein
MQNQVPMQKQVTFVSAYYTLNATPYFNQRPDEWDPAPIYDLVRSGIQLCLYIGEDCTFEDAFEELEKECANFRVMPYRLHYKDTWIHRALIEEFGDNEFPLPSNRNLDKDTLEYMIYMNSRPEIIEDAISENPWDSTHFAWIDFNTPKLFSKKSESLETLANIARYPFPPTAAYFSGCWPKLESAGISGIAKSIHWRFCGAFFLADVKSLTDFAEIYRSKFKAFLKEYGTFTWEVNFWAWLEYTGDWYPTWYRGDHNDSILNIFSGISADTYATGLSEEDVIKKTEYVYPEIATFYPGSASYLEHEGRHYLNTRFVNYWMYSNGYYRFHNTDMVIENRNLLSNLDKNTLEPVDFLEIGEQELYDLSGSPLIKPIREKRSFSVGLEDIRLFSGLAREDGTRPIRFIATNVEYSHINRNRMIVGTYDVDTATYRDCVQTVPPDPNSWCEKNWIPVIQFDEESGREEERFIYKWSPMEIGRIDPATNQLNIVLRHEIKQWIFGKLRGSTTFITAPLAFLPDGVDPEKEYLLGLAHFSEEHSPRHYYHILILLEKSTLKPVRYSRVFYFEKLSIEFCVGMATKPSENSYVFWISRFDRDPIMIEVKKDALLFTNIAD